MTKKRRWHVFEATEDNWYTIRRGDIVVLLEEEWYYPDVSNKYLVLVQPIHLFNPNIPNSKTASLTKRRVFYPSDQLQETLKSIATQIHYEQLWEEQSTK